MSVRVAAANHVGYRSGEELGSHLRSDARGKLFEHRVTPEVEIRGDNVRGAVDVI
jgi:hypothetical protein